MRKHAKDTGGDGGAGVEVEALDDGGDGRLLLFSARRILANALAQTRSRQRRKRLQLSCLGRSQQFTPKY